MLTEIKTKSLHYFVDEHNLRQGEFKTYHNNGQLYEHTFYLNGKRHGEYKEYHENGQLSVHTFYQNVKQHGEFKSYYENGKIKYATFCYQNRNLHVNPDSLTEKDKVYIMMSGRLPSRV